MDASIKLAVVRESVPTLKPYLYGQSVAFLFSKGGSEPSLGSGSLVSIGHRLFIATAAHTVPMNAGSEIHVLCRTPQQLFDSTLPILRKNIIPTERPDVGYLELDALSALNVLEKEACPIERIAVLGPGRATRPLMLVGNPGEYVNHRQYASAASGGTAPAVVPLMISFFTTALMQAEWPAMAPAPDEGTDIFLDYPASEAEEIENRQPIFLPNPQGMSGGGLWDLGFETGVMWTHQAAKLFGILSRWHETHRYVRAVQIIHWLRLIHQDYPDLRPHLESRFPELEAAN